jgi:molecular chaperone IbpA
MPNGSPLLITRLKGEKTMTLGRISFGPLSQTTLGFDKFFDDVERLMSMDVQKSVSNFPPHNILKLDESRYIVELAVAGFSKDEIEISVEEGTLTVKGEKDEKESNVQYLHKGIGTRSFTKTLTIADTIEVKGAEFKDGILRIGLENIIPEHKKPRKIAIGENLKEFKPQLLQEKSAA